MPLTSEIIRRIVEAFPDESDETIKAIAKVQGLASRAWDWGNKPLANFGSETIQNPIGRFAAQLGEGMTSPIGLGSLALSGGAALAGKAGMLGLARSGLVGEAALNAPAIAHGAYTAGTADTMGGKAAGLLEAGLGTLGTYGPAKALRRMNINRENIPAMLAAARKNGGVSMDPDLGDLGGKPGWAVGGMEVPERQASTALEHLPPGELDRFVQDYARPLGMPERFPGLWQDSKTGKAAMDVTTRVHRPQDAFREGILADQQSIFDLGSFNERQVRDLPVRTRNAILKGAPESPEAFGSPSRFGSMLALQPGEIRGLAEAGDQDALSALLRLAQDETGALGPNAKRQLDWFEQAAKAHPTLKPPTMKSLQGTMERGHFRGKGGADRGLQLREGAIPDFKQNTQYNLDQVLKVSPKRGAYFAPHIEKRIDQILKFVDDKGIDPASIDWTNPEWMKAFNTPHDAQVFAKLVGSLSPQKELLPNMRDAISVVLQDRMGIPTTQMAAPFGRRGTGFGFGFGYDPEGSTLKNLAKALKNEPIGTLFPNKVNELAEGPLGNMSALPWDMHWARGLGLKSDIAGSPLEYALMKMAGEDAMKARGFQGAFPGMAKLWTGEKMAVAGHEPGMVEYVRRLQTKMPELFRGYTPRSEADFFNTLADAQQAMGGKLSKAQMEAIRAVTAGRLFF